MSFVGLTSILLNLMGAQTIEPDTIGFFGNVWSIIGNVAVDFFQSVCSIFYVVCKWFLAIVDFLQYFIQKLIGLDYWLNIGENVSESTTLAERISGATDADLLFSFLYNETVQNVFQAMTGVFIVLLIVFTIFAIIKQEWTFATSGFDGDGNSKASIFRSSLKAIGLVLVFPMILIIGIISSNAILASLVGALNIDMGQTFGSTLFSIASQSANKYRVYADNDQRTAVSQEVTFYIDSNGKLVLLSDGSTGTDASYVNYISDYTTYMETINSSSTEKYTVNTIFDLVNPSAWSLFSGYCVALEVEGANKYFMVRCESENKTAMYYYLRNVLQAKIVTQDTDANQSLGLTKDDAYSSIYKDIKKKFKSVAGKYAFIEGLYLGGFGDTDPIIKACYNTWGYSSVYSHTTLFNTAEDYAGMKSTDLEKLGLESVSGVKLMYNSGEISSYFDGGQFGVVQKQSEYYVMADVVDFMNESGATLYMIDATSNMILWNYTDQFNTDYHVDSRYVSSIAVDYTDTNLKESSPFYYNNYDNSTNHSKMLPFVVSYSEECQDSEAGNILYTAKSGKSSELDGTVYIMCWKITEGTAARYIPLVNGLEFTDPLTKENYIFKSSYLANNYHGLVVAKGTFETSSTNANLGEPTYIKTTAETSGTFWGNLASLISGSSDEMYYYTMTQTADFSQWFDTKQVKASSAFSEISSVTLSSSYDGVTVTADKSNEDTADDLADATDIVWKAKETIEKADGTTAVADVTFSDGMIKDLTIRIKTGSSTSTYATYADQIYTDSNGVKYYLFLTKSNYYFLVSPDNAAGYIRVLAATSTDTAGVIDTTHGVGAGQSSTFYGWAGSYNFRYNYVSKDGSLNINNNTENTTIYANQFSYSSTKEKGVSLFQTDDMQFVNVKQGNTTIYEKTMYVNSYFNTSSSYLASVTSSEGIMKIEFADPYSSSSSYTHKTAFFRVDMYDYYTAAVGSSTGYTLRKYDVSESKVSTDTNITPGLTFTINVNATDFKWGTGATSVGLYDGKNYVAMIYKLDGTVITSVSDIATKSTKILYDYQEFYNLGTQNLFATEGDMDTHYDNIRSSLIVGFYRDNAGGIVGTLKWFGNIIEWDFHLALFGGWRFKMVIAPNEMTHADLAGYFTLEDGVSFDYFFDRTTVQELNNEGVGLATFFMPSKISYWIILIASALIIKVLGTAIWGVIKRFYEITLLFIAMPAVASTIPLDNGDRFKRSISDPLISKVLGTYGVILGINAFFVLLAPVKSLSQIFTAEDIATSGSYFLQHLPIGAKLLNNYVYILFVLVAFTMIDALPKTISSLVGSNDDILGKGKETKEQVGQTMKAAGDVISGQSLINTANQVKQGVMGAIPGSKLMEKPLSYMKNIGSGGGGGGGSDSSSKEDGEVEEESETSSDSGSGGGSGDSGGGSGGGDSEESSDRAPDVSAEDAEAGPEVDPMEIVGGEMGELTGDVVERGMESMGFDVETSEAIAAGADKAVEGVVEEGEVDLGSIAGNVVGGAAEKYVGDKVYEATGDETLANISGKIAGEVGEYTGKAVEKVAETAAVTYFTAGTGTAVEVADGAVQTVGAVADVAGTAVEGVETVADVAETAVDSVETVADTAETVVDGVESVGEGIGEAVDAGGETLERIGELDNVIDENLADGFNSADESIGFYDEAIKEEEQIDNEIAQEKEKRSKWIKSAAKKNGVEESEQDDFVTANDAVEHDEQNLPYKAELAASSDRLKELEAKKAELASMGAREKKAALESAIAEKTALEDKLLEEQIAKESATAVDNIDASEVIPEGVVPANVAQDGAVVTETGEQIPATETGEQTTDSSDVNKEAVVAEASQAAVKAAESAEVSAEDVSAATNVISSTGNAPAGANVGGVARPGTGTHVGEMDSAYQGVSAEGDGAEKQKKKHPFLRKALKVAKVAGLVSLGFALPGGFLTLGAGMLAVHGAKKVTRAAVGGVKNFTTTHGKAFTGKLKKLGTAAGVVGGLAVASSLPTGLVVAAGTAGVVVAKKIKAKKASKKAFEEFANNGAMEPVTGEAGPFEDSVGVNDTKGVGVSTPIEAFDVDSETAKTPGQMIAGVANGTVEPEVAADNATITEFNNQALDDKEFVDDRLEARANVVKNRVGSKVGQIIVSQVLSDYGAEAGDGSAESNISAAINGKGSVKGLLTDNLKHQAIASTLKGSDLESFNALDTEGKNSFMSARGLGVSASVGLGGQIGFSITDAKNNSKSSVGKDTANSLISQMLSSDSIGDEAINVAINKTNYSRNVDAALAQNLSLGVDFNKADASTTSSMLAKSVYDQASKDDDIVAEAMLKHIESNKDSELYGNFQATFGISNETNLNDSKTRARVLDQIKMFKNSDNPNMINAMKEGDYASELTAVVRDKAQGGGLKITAWQLADNGTRDAFKQKTAANLEAIQGNSILNGASKADQNAILINTATAYMGSRANGKATKAIEGLAFAANVSKEDIAKLEPKALAEITGKSSFEELTNGDKQLLGFMKARKGSLENVNLQNVGELKKSFKDDNARLNAFARLGTDAKITAINASGQKEVFAQMATQDASLALSKADMTALQAEYITSGNLTDETTLNHLQKLYEDSTGKKDFKEAMKRKPDQIKSFLNKNAVASNLVLSDMKNNKVDFASIVNDKFDVKYARTKDEAEREKELSVAEVLKDSPDSLYHAFIKSDIDGKSTITNDLFTKVADISDENSAGYKDAVGKLKKGFGSSELATFMAGNGMLEQDMVAAYKKAELLGETGKQGFNLNSLLKYSSQSDAVDRQLLGAIESKTPADKFKGLANGVLDSITPEQKNLLANSIANSGFEGLSKADQDKLLAGGKTKDDFKGLSYYELKRRMEGQSSKEIYEGIKSEVSTEKTIEQTLDTQGDLIGTDRLKNYIDETEDVNATAYVADTFAGKVSMLTNEEQDAIRRKTSRSVIGEEAYAKAEASAASSIDKAQTHELYTALNSDGVFKEYVKQVKSSKDFKDASKGENFDEEAYIVNELVGGIKDGKVDSERRGSLSRSSMTGYSYEHRFNRIISSARENAVISEALKDNEALAVSAMNEGDKAVELENKRRLATVMTAKGTADAQSNDRYASYASVISRNYDLMNRANIAFRATSGGKDLNEVDSMTKNNFLATTFANSLSGRDKEWFNREKISIDASYAANIIGGKADEKLAAQTQRKGYDGQTITSTEHLANVANQRNISIDQALLELGYLKSDSVSSDTSVEELNKIISKNVSQEQFNSIYSEAKRENFGDEAGVFRDVKREIIKEQITGKDNLTPAVNVEAMSSEEKNQYNFSKNLIQQSIRNDDNPALLANAFRNVNLIDSRKMVESIYAKDGIKEVTDKDGKKVSIADADLGTLKAGLSNEQINAYLKGHEAVKDKLIDHVSANAMLGMDEETKNQRQSEAVLNNSALSTQVALAMLGNRRTNSVTNGIASGLVDKANAGLVSEDANLRKKLGLKANASQSEIKEAVRKNKSVGELDSAASEALKTASGSLAGDSRVAEAVKKDSAMLASLGLNKKATDNDIYNSLFGTYNEQTGAFEGRHANADLVARSLMLGLNKNEAIASVKGNANALKGLGLKANASDDDIFSKLNAQTNSELVNKALAHKLKTKTNRTETEEAAYEYAYGNKEKTKQYINKNKSHLEAEYARDLFFETDANGKTRLKEGVKPEQFNSVVEKLKTSSKAFDKGVYGEVTKAINPNSVDSAAKADFFRGLTQDVSLNHISGDKAGVVQLGGIKGAFDTFMKDKDSEKYSTNGLQAMWYKVSKKLPEQSAAYDNWNRVLEKKIQDIKNGGGMYANMSKSARQAEVAKYASQKIGGMSSEDFAKMSNEEQRKYTESQNKLKHEAMNVGDFNALYKAGVAVTSVKKPSVLKSVADNIGYNLNFTGSMASQDVKDKHKQDLTNIDANIARYNATKAMRNKNVDFGSNFKTFANSYFNNKQSNDIIYSTNKEFLKKYKGEEGNNNIVIGDNFKFSDLNKKQQEELIKMRENAFASKMNKLHVVASKKVAKDAGVDHRSYLEQKGIETETVKYKDGSKKYTHVQSKVNLHIPGVNAAVNKVITAKRVSDIKKYDEEFARTGGDVSEKTKKRYENSFYGKRSVESAVKNQNQAIELQKTFDKVAEFNRNYRGNGKDYAAAFKSEFGSMADQIYNNYKKRFKVADLASSSAAVQQREVMKHLQEQMEKTSKRMTYGSAYIPATASNAYVYVGKTMTGAKTSTEIKLDRMNAEDLNRALKQFNADKGVLNYENIFNKLKPSLQEGFTKQYKSKLGNMNDMQRKDALAGYLERELRKANNKVHNNNFLRSDASTLQNLNGTLVKRSQVNNGISKTMMSALTTNESKIYQNIVNTYNSAQRKYNEEQANLTRLGNSLKGLKSGVQSQGTRVEQAKVRGAIDSSTIRLSVLRKELDQAFARKRAFEKKIVEEKVVRRAPAPIAGNVRYSEDLFGKYRFPTKNGGMIRPGTPEAAKMMRAIDRMKASYGPAMDRLKLDIDSMIRRRLIKQEAEFVKKINTYVKKQTSEFGSTLRSLNRTQQVLETEIKRLKSSTKREDIELRDELKTHSERLRRIQSNLETSLDDLDVKVSEVAKITNK